LLSSYLQTLLVICPGDIWANFKYRMINLYLLSNIFPIYRELWSKELLKKFIRNDYNLVTIVDCLEQDLVVKNINKLLL